MKKTKFYIHTLDGKPAYFNGNQIVFASRFGNPAKSVSSLREIRKEQRASARWRIAKGYGDSMWEIGYVRFC